MHDTKMFQAEMDSTRKNTQGSVEKSLVLVVTITKLLWHLPCLFRQRLVDWFNWLVQLFQQIPWLCRLTLNQYRPMSRQ